MENQDKNMFELEENEAYAVEVWQAMRFVNELKAVALNELLPEDQICSICRQPYGNLEKDATGCEPVQLPCSHIFGKVCLAIWITPLGGWSDSIGQWEEEKNWFEDPFIGFSGRANCPICRRELFEKPKNWESGKGLEARLMLWDRAYEKVGCLRSEKEEQSRADLIRYLEFYRKANGNTIERTEAEIDQRWSELKPYHEVATGILFYFVRCQKKNHVLNPTQARLQRNLEQISILGLDIPLDDPSFDNFKNRHGDYENFELVMEQREDNDGGNDSIEGNREEDIDRQAVNGEVEEQDREPVALEPDDNDDHTEEAE